MRYKVRSYWVSTDYVDVPDGIAQDDDELEEWINDYMNDVVPDPQLSDWEILG